MKRALVLGGGGNVGIAWEIAILAGLLDGGVDARDADLVIGTSAGSVVGTHIAHGRDPRELLQEQSAADPPAALGGLPQPDMSIVQEAFAAWTAASEMTEAACAAVGAAALKGGGAFTEERWLASFERHAWPGWPQKALVITAVACETGRFFAIDRDSGVDVARACAASCAVPGLFPPVTVDGVRYMDGGVRSGTSADLAQRIEPDAVLIVAPLGRGNRGIHLLCAKQLASEAAALQSVGAAVKVVQMDDAALAAGGQNLMDHSLRLPTAEAGYAHGRRLAPEFAPWWSR